MLCVTLIVLTTLSAVIVLIALIVAALIVAALIAFATPHILRRHPRRSICSRNQSFGLQRGAHGKADGLPAFPFAKSSQVFLGGLVSALFASHLCHRSKRMTLRVHGR